MLTVAEAAAHATVSEALIRQWLKEGTLPHFRVGARGRRGKILIAIDDLDGVLANFKVGRRGPPEKPPVSKTAFKHLKL